LLCLVCLSIIPKPFLISFWIHLANCIVWKSHFSLTDQSAVVTMLSIVSLLRATFTMRFIRPIEETGDQLERISTSQLRGGRIRIKHTGREVEKLESEVNRALERIEELIDDTRKMSSKIAHELRTPLVIMKTGLQLSLERNFSEQEVTNTLLETLSELDKMIRMSEVFFCSRIWRARLHWNFRNSTSPKCF